LETVAPQTAEPAPAPATQVPPAESVPDVQDDPPAQPAGEQQ
jgi:hypothetical protein